MAEFPAEVENYLQGYMAQQGIKVDVHFPEYKAFLQKVLQDNYPIRLTQQSDGRQNC